MIAILVVNYNTSTQVRQLLYSLVPGIGRNKVVVSIIDNSLLRAEYRRLIDLGSAVRSESMDVVITRSTENVGYGSGNNAALDAVKSFRPRIVIVMNPDTHWHSGSLDSIAEFLDQNPGTLVSAPTKSVEGGGPGLAYLNPWSGQSRDLTSADELRTRRFAYPSGHFIGLSADSWEKLRGFSPRYFLFCEELDMLLRSQKLGFELSVGRNFEVTHEGGVSTGAYKDPLRKSITTYYCGTLSRILLYRQHRALWVFLPALVASRLILALNCRRLRQMPGCRAVLYGVYDGLIQPEVSGRRRLEKLGRGSGT